MKSAIAYTHTHALHSIGTRRLPQRICVTVADFKDGTNPVLSKRNGSQLVTNIAYCRLANKPFRLRLRRLLAKGLHPCADIETVSKRDNTHDTYTIVVVARAAQPFRRTETPTRAPGCVLFDTWLLSIKSTSGSRLPLMRENDYLFVYRHSRVQWFGQRYIYFALESRLLGYVADTYCSRLASIPSLLKAHLLQSNGYTIVQMEFNSSVRASIVLTRN